MAKKNVKRIVLTEGKGEIISRLIDEYDIKTAKDIHNALKDLMGGTIKAMLEAEMEDHVGSSYYERRNNDGETSENYRNGYKPKTVKSSMGDFSIDVPQDRDSSFNPILLPKRSKDISEIEEKIIRMYARGFTNADITQTIDEIYGFRLDESLITNITNKIIPEAEEWKTRVLDKVYPVIFIDATVFSVREEGRVSKKAAYIIIGIGIDGIKDVLSIEIGDSESSKYWVSVLNSLKSRGLKDIFIICSDRLTGIKEAIQAVYPMADWQGCMVHMVRNTLKYVSYKDKKEFANDLKTIYKSITEEEALSRLDDVKYKWDKKYPGCMDRWYNNWDNISPMFSYSDSIRRIIYTTNAIESLNSSYKRINKARSVFPNKTSLFKALYLATTVITKKWTMPIRDWGVIYSELLITFRDRVET